MQSTGLFALFGRTGYRTPAIFGVVIAGLTIAGCASKPAKSTSPQASEDTLRLVRQSMTASDPNVLVGLVVAVLPDKKYAAIGDLDMKDFHEGDPVTFIDANKKFITNGLVRHIGPDQIDVEYEMPMATSPAPQKGDLAVRFKS